MREQYNWKRPRCSEKEGTPTPPSLSSFLLGFRPECLHQFILHRPPAMTAQQALEQRLGRPSSSPGIITHPFVVRDRPSFFSLYNQSFKRKLSKDIDPYDVR